VRKSRADPHAEAVRSKITRRDHAARAQRTTCRQPACARIPGSPSSVAELHWRRRRHATDCGGAGRKTEI
jgi:hypothetical protein